MLNSSVLAARQKHALCGIGTARAFFRGTLIAFPSLRNDDFLEGEIMLDQPSQDSLTRSSPKDIESMRGLTNASLTGEEQQEPYQEQEAKSRLSDLQQCICELLIKNQQLRELLNLTTNYLCQECANEYERNLTRLYS
jgi:hypothetical protein